MKFKRDNNNVLDLGRKIFPNWIMTT